MNILSTQYTLATKSFEIYVAGCKAIPHCKGCHSKESWDFNAGEIYTEELLNKMLLKIEEFDGLIDNIWILGGDPLDNNIREVCKMAVDFAFRNKNIWLFTRYSLEEVEIILKENIILFDYIKCGRYEKNLITNDNIQYGIKLATSNQKIYKEGVDY